MSRELNRRQLNRYLLAGLAIGSASIAGCSSSERTPGPDPQPGPDPRPDPSERSPSQPEPEPTLDFDEQVAELRSKFFDGPANDVVDLDSLDPSRRSEANQIGVCAEFQHLADQPAARSEQMLAYAVAAGVTWLRTGFRYHDWDFDGGNPPRWLDRLLDNLGEHGIRPLLQTSAREFLGTSQHTGRWLQLVRAALDQWGDRVPAFQFYNEPHEIWSEKFAGGYWGGSWLNQYASFVGTASRRLKDTHPNLILVNGIHLPGVAIGQFRRSDPKLDVVDWHNYPHLDDLPPELVGYAKDQRFVAQASQSTDFAQVARDYRDRSAALLNGGDGRNASGSGDKSSSGDKGGKPPEIWMTETGLPSEPYGEHTQARYIARMYTLALAAEIKTFCYQLSDRDGQPERAAHFGLTDARLRPKPSYFAFGRISALTGGQVRADPDFQPESVVSSEPAGDRPRFDATVGGRGRRIAMSERIEALKLDRDDGAVLLAIWSTRPIDPELPPRRATVRLPGSYGSKAVLVDPITGGSRRLRPDTDTELEVFDYPVFVLYH